MPVAQVLRLEDHRMIERIRILDSVCFPVKYSESYYFNIGSFQKGDPERNWTDLNNVAFFNELLVGSITSRMEPYVLEPPGGADGEIDYSNEEKLKELHSPVPNRFRVYIMTLCVLEPYRRMGLAKQLVQRVVDYVKNRVLEVEEVGLHVQMSNEAALQFYKKMGFDIRYTGKNYYTDIEPTVDAFYLSIKFDRKK